MKSKPSFEPHLVIKEVVLRAGGEWAAQSAGWALLHFTRGVGYWLHPRGNHELPTGAVLLLSDRSQGTIRASQVGEAQIHAFRLQPERLTGLVTLSEQQFFQNAASLEQFAFRIFRPTDPIAEAFRKLCNANMPGKLRTRLQLLDLFAQAFGADLPNQTATVTHVVDAKTRLTQMLSQTPLSELLELSFAELVREMRCTPRHLSRIFHEVVGMSFREKQAQVRLVRAQELLATTRCKVVEVALESGYPSLSLFNLMFKKRFGVTPGKWREQNASRKFARKSVSRGLVIRAC